MNNNELFQAFEDNGVIFLDKSTVYIQEGVSIGQGTIIGPSVMLEKNTSIGENCHIIFNTRISNSIIGDNTTIESSVIVDSRIGNDTQVGPFAYVRPNSNIGNNCRIGDFVEIKNSTLGSGTKASHLTYIGDADLGENINLGCGVVFVNYDGKNKTRSQIEDNAFVGCNSNIISPVRIGKNAYIAAGTTLTNDVPEDALAIGRSKQSNKEGWSKKAQLFGDYKNK